MKLTNYILVFFSVALCFAFVLFINVDITKKINIQNIEYSSKLTSACFDAAQTMNTDNVERYGCVWHDADDLKTTLETFYNSLTYSFNWDNMGRVDEMALFTPVVCLVDVDGYYISHNVVFNDTGTVNISFDAEHRNGLTALNAWTDNYGGVLLRYFLNDNVEVICLDGTKIKGNRIEVYKKLQEDFPSGAEVTELSFITDDDEFERRKNELIVQEINDQCEYYINNHNVIGDSYENKYSFEMPEIAGQDWMRLLQNPTVISFLQGYSTKADNRLLNVYSLGGGELIENFHYFIDGDTYHCLEKEGGVTRSTRDVNTSYESEGVTKTKHTTYVEYSYNGHLIDAIYSNQTDCAKRGAYPCECVYNFNI